MDFLLDIVFLTSFVQYGIFITFLCFDDLEVIEIHKKVDLLYWIIPGGVLIILGKNC